MRLAFSIFLLLGLVGGAHAEEKLVVASLSTVLSDIAQNVGGDKVEVISIIKPGIDPHEFMPSASDVQAISGAKIVLLSGNGQEAAYLSKLEASVGNGPEFLAVGDSVKPLMVTEDAYHDHGHAHGASEGGKVRDPHWWHSIPNAKVATDVIRDAFIAADPADKAAFTANAATYQKKLDALQKWARVTIAQLPRDKRHLVTSHDAFGYFARDYGFTVHAIEGISTEDQPSSGTVRKIIDAIREEGVKSIFLENIQNPKVLTEITRETGAKTGGVLYADGLGDKEATTYEDMIRHNYSTIVEGLK
jgi:zinc/manganese transport system substrate-binding protein